VDPRISFFPKRKVRLELTSWVPKLNTQGEKRVRIDFTLPLLDEARDQEMPFWMIPSLAAMEQPDSAQGKTKLEDVELEGITIELWDTPTSVTRAELLAAITLSDFYLERVTRDKQTFIALTFQTNIPRAGMLKFVDKYETRYLWCEFTPADPAKATPPTPGVQMTIADVKSSAANDVEQTPEEAQVNAENFLKKDGAEEPEAELATAGKPEQLKRPRGFSPKGAA
jgi:hypothetical protein